MDIKALASLLSLVSGGRNASTPTLEICEDFPTKGYLPDGPVVVVSSGGFHYKVILVISASHNLPDAVIGRLFCENLQHGLEKFEAELKGKRSLEVLMEFLATKEAAFSWARKLPRPEDSRTGDFPFVITWCVGEEQHTMGATTLISYGEDLTPEKRAALEEEFTRRQDLAEAENDTATFH